MFTVYKELFHATISCESKTKLYLYLKYVILLERYNNYLVI